MSDPTQTTRTLKLIERAKDSTLTGYLFTDLKHAYEWLTQKWVKPELFALQEVDVGPLVRCRRCDGSGFHQTVKPLRRLTVDEFLRETANGK